MAAEFLPPLVGRVVADVGEYTSKLTQAGKDAENLEGKGGGSFNRLKQVGGAAFLGLAAGAAALAGASIHLADEFEASHARLTAAVAATGVPFNSLQARVAATDATMTKFGYNNTQTEGALARLVQMTGNASGSMANMGLVANIAAARHIDLESAANLVGKVMSGNVAILNRMGISLPLATANALALKKAHDQVAVATANLNKVEADIAAGRTKGTAAATALAAAHTKLSAAQAKVADLSTSAGRAIDALTQKFGGQAQAQADTFGGKMKVVEAQATNIGIAIGMWLIPKLEDLMSIGSGVISFLEKHRDIAIALAAAIGGPLVIAMGMWAVSMIPVVGEFLVLAAPFIAIGVAIGALVYLILHFSQVWGMLSSAVQTAVSAVIGWIQRLPATIMGLVASAPTWLAQAGTDLLNGLLAGIEAGAQLVWGWFTALPGVLGAFFVAALNWLPTAGQAILQGMLNGIGIGFQLVVAFFIGLPLAILNFFLTADVWLIEKGVAILTGLFNGIVRYGPTVFAWFVGLPGQILGLLGNAAGWLLNVGIAALTGLLNGIVNAAPAVWSWFTGLPGRILSALSGLPGLLVNAGEQLIQGLIHGIENAAGGIVGAITKNIPGGGIIGSAAKALGLYKGGTAFAGQAHVVGERGPELFVPEQTGTVIPNGQAFGPGSVTGGGGGTNVSVSIVVQGSVTTERELVTTIGSGLVDQLRRKGIKV